MHELKKLTFEGIENALRKAERYRFLAEPLEAESIYVDVLDVDPDNHEARVLLILSLTDQFRRDLSRVAEAATLAGELEDEYERFYYSGIVAERMGKVQLTRSGPSSDDYANRALRKAMAWYEKAEAIRPPGDDDTIVRWNTCARAIARRGFTVPPDLSSSALVMLE
jgi:tetratricopeptide (TPR) repeat protein